MRKKLAHPSAPTRVLAALALPALLLLLYLAAIRPSQMHWGATAEEIARPMPGDELVSAPDLCATRAVTIAAAPQAIWPWIAQMGYRRAGFYGYDLIENIGSPRGLLSANSILPVFQNPKTGDELPISAVASMSFGPIQPESYLVWTGTRTPSNGSFTWALYPLDPTHTRIVSRARIRYHWTDPRLLPLDLFTEFADPVAVPRILYGIKARVEGRPPQSLPAEAAEISVWLALLAQFAAAWILLFRWRRWGRAWLLGLLAGLAFLFALYAHAPAWTGAILAAGILAGFFLQIRANSRYSSPT